MKYLLVSFLTFFILSSPLFGQESALYFEVQGAKSSNVRFENAIFEEKNSDISALGSFVNPDEVYFFGNVSLDVKRNRSKAINLVMPLKTKNMVLELIETPESFYNYEVVTSSGETFAANREIRHYRGIVQGEKNSLVAITFYENEVIGLIATNEGNFNIVKDRQSGKHLFYNERNLREKPDVACGTVGDPSFSYEPEILFGERDTLSEKRATVQTRVINKEVRLHVEAEYSVYQEKGSVSSVEAYIAGIFNQVTVIFLNDSILATVSHMYIWNSNDPYTGTINTSPTLLTEFSNEIRYNRGSIIGDLGILVAYRSIGGGLAYVDRLCYANDWDRLAVSVLSDGLVPGSTIYTMSVYVITHELGHLLGSRHTQACVWNGNNTAIDGCATTEGGCPSPGYPPNGGTIMSYCHQNVGINFNLGFGPQPGAIIRNRVRGASCLQPCNSPLNFTNQTITQGVIINSCGDVNISNTTVTPTGTLNLQATNAVNIEGNFTVESGGSLNINAGP